MKESLFKPAVVGSLALLVGSAQFFAYASYVVPRAKATQDLQALTEILQLEKQKKKLVETQTAGKPVKAVEDRIYEIEDEIRLLNAV